MSCENSSDNMVKIQGFNNLVKTLTFTTCRIIRVESEELTKKFMDELNAEWGTKKFRALFDLICQKLDATILNISSCDFDPSGASVNALLSDSKYGSNSMSYAHLDKSHMAVHTYPEINPHNGIVTFRADFDISTCGLISPLRILDILMEEIGFNVITIDYKVRGFTRTTDGQKVYNDRQVNSIMDFMKSDYKRRFEYHENNFPDINTWQTRMMRTEIDWAEYLFENVSGKSGRDIVHKEMRDIYSMSSGEKHKKRSMPISVSGVKS